MKIELRYQWQKYWREKLPMWIAFHLPKRIAFWCFIRVHSLVNEGPAYKGEYQKAAEAAETEWKLK